MSYLIESIDWQDPFFYLAVFIGVLFMYEIVHNMWHRK